MFNWFINFLHLTAWPMEVPKAYGTFHLAFFFGGLFVSIVLAYLLRNTNEKQNKIFLLCCGIFLILTEIYKVFFILEIKNNWVFPWYAFSFQLCSIPMYLCIIIPFIKSQKIKDSLYDYLLAFNLMSGFIAFLEPSGLVHEYWTLTLHAFVWHMMLVFIGLYLGFSRRAGLSIKNYKRAVKVFLVLCVIAFGFNLAFWNISNGGLNCFYIGPATSPIIVFKDISKNLGWYVNMPIYIACICLGAFLFFLPFTIFNKKHPKKAI